MVIKIRSVAEGDERSIPNISFVVFDPVSMQQSAKLIFEILFGVMLFLFYILWFEKAVIKHGA